MSNKTLRKFAEEYDSKLLATDERFNHWVHIVHSDGSVFLFNHAFILNVSSHIIVFTEHHSWRIFDLSDLVSKIQFDQIFKTNE